MRNLYHVKLKVEIDVMVVGHGESDATRTALTHAHDEFVARGPFLTEKLGNVCEIEVTQVVSKDQLQKDFPQWAQGNRPWGDDDDGKTVESYIPSPLQALAGAAEDDAENG